MSEASFPMWLQFPQTRVAVRSRLSCLEEAEVGGCPWGQVCWPEVLGSAACVCIKFPPGPALPDLPAPRQYSNLGK